MPRRVITMIYAGALLLLPSIAVTGQDTRKARVVANQPVHNIVEYGAVGDGKTLNTVAIQKAVDSCAAQGGGKVLVPAGDFVSGPVFLKSNVNFHLGAGATLRGSRNIKDFPRQKMETHGHLINEFRASLLTGFKLENVSITGRGVLDGQGEVWWKEKDAGRGGSRPVVIYLCDCRRVSIGGVKVINSPSWTILPLLCRNVSIHNITIKNPWKPYHNCDGIDVHSCSNVRISDCYIDTGDDGICLKSIPDWFVSANGTGTVDYSKPRIPCENVVIENCVVEHAHSGVGIWAEVIGGLQNVVINNCVFDGTRAGIRIARYPWPGGYVKNIRASNIVMRRVEWVIELSSELPGYMKADGIKPGPDAESTPVFQNIHFSNITATRARMACEMHGMTAAPVRDVSFNNIRIDADKGFDIRNAENILLDNVEVACRGPALCTEDVRNLEVNRLVGTEPQADVPIIQLTSTSDVWVRGCTAVAGTGTFVGIVGDGNRDVLLQGNRLSRAKREQGPADPSPTWSSSSYAYSGSAMWRTSGNRNSFLPVPGAVLKTIRREWDANRILYGINGIHRLESGARPDVRLPSGDRREIYIVMAWQVPETLLIAEDGELLRKDAEFDYRAFLK